MGHEPMLGSTLPAGSLWLLLLALCLGTLLLAALVVGAYHLGALRERLKVQGQLDALKAEHDALSRRLESGASTSSAATSDAELFSFSLSHDLKAPLRVVEGFARIVKEDYATRIDRIGNDHLDRVLAAAARMNHMIDALLGLARLSSRPPDRQPVNLSQMAGFIIEDLRRHEPERMATVHLQAGIVVQADPALMRVVMENLLGNAWKYSARAGHTEIEFTQAALPDGRLACCVRDRGAGFDMRQAERLFGAFQRLHAASEFPGHGIGLASVRRVVQHHGGQVWAEGEVGQGARFYFTVPAA